MLRLDLVLTEGLAEQLHFSLLDLQGQPVNAAAHNWSAYASAHEHTALQVHIAGESAIVIDMPALDAGDWYWSLTQNDSVFLWGALTVKSKHEIEQLAHTSYSLKNDKPAPGAKMTVEDTHTAVDALSVAGAVLNGHIDLQRVSVDKLPPVDKANPWAAYFVGSTPWVVQNGLWLRQESIYKNASPIEPGLLICKNSSDTGITGAPVRISADAQQHEVAAALPGNPAENGVVALSDDFVSHDNVDGLRVRRASAGSSKPGLVRVVGTDQEAMAHNELDVFSAQRSEQEIENIVDLVGLIGKLNPDASNTAEGIDIVVDYGSTLVDGEYLWWRVWKSGRVEQGGCIPPSRWEIVGNHDYPVCTLNFPVEMADTDYILLLTPADAGMFNRFYAADFYESTDSRTEKSVILWYGSSYPVPLAPRWFLIGKVK